MKTCFVIMPIGEIKDLQISESNLRDRYNHLIKEALLKVAPDLDVTRADEVSSPGMITGDIFTRLMHSDLVVADITFSNPNVFYELGIRHAIKPGTIILKEKNGATAPFDVSGLRQIQYEYSPAGIKKLSEELEKRILWFRTQPDKPDNGFLELAQFTKYKFPNYSEPSATEVEADLVLQFLQNPRLIELFLSAESKEMTPEIMSELVQTSPDVMRNLMGYMIKSKGSLFKTN